jgi:hypothetical protein
MMVFIEIREGFVVKQGIKKMGQDFQIAMATGGV